MQDELLNDAGEVETAEPSSSSGVVLTNPDGSAGVIVSEGGDDPECTGEIEDSLAGL